MLILSGQVQIELPAGEKAKSGVAFYDVSDPVRPKELAFVPAVPDGKTHGLDIGG